jgi:hypothetical protein
MPFEKIIVNAYHELNNPTKYRFAEIEIGKALSILTDLYRTKYQPRAAAVKTMYELLIPQRYQGAEMETQFIEAFRNQRTFNPPKAEVIHYLLVRGHSYTKIRNLTSASFNTIAAMRFGLPEYYPSFPNWTPDILLQWESVKKGFNLFNEELAHMKETESKQ